MKFCSHEKFPANKSKLSASTALVRNVSPDIPDEKGRTALHIAAALGHTIVIEMLLNAGATMGLKDFRGNTAIEVVGEQTKLEGQDRKHILQMFLVALAREQVIPEDDKVFRNCFTVSSMVACLKSCFSLFSYWPLHKHLQLLNFRSSPFSCEKCQSKINTPFFH